MFKMSLNKSVESLSKKKLKQFRKDTIDRIAADLSKKNILDAWEKQLNGPESDLKIVHSVSGFGSLTTRAHYTNSPFYNSPAEELFSKWDVISCSCLYKKTIGDKSIGRGSLSIHLNLKVPVQNILGIHRQDVYFDNFAGFKDRDPQNEIENRFALVDSIFKGIAKPNKSSFKMDKPYNTLIYPDEIIKLLLQRRKENYYNEFLIIGKQNIRMYTDYPATEKVELSGISFMPWYIINDLKRGRISSEKMKGMETDLAFIRILMQINNKPYFIFSPYGYIGQDLDYIDGIFSLFGFERIPSKKNCYKLKPTMDN
ncbi:hypothetical protein [Enterobacter bugandensis]